MKFTELGLQPRLLKALDSLGYHDATPIQQQVIESFTNGSHIVGQSQTGTGKTAAFVLPIVNTIDPKVKHVQTLVLVPTRELAVQVREEFFNLSKGLIGFRSVAVYGGGGSSHSGSIAGRAGGPRPLAQDGRRVCAQSSNRSCYVCGPS
ncbi:MAG TPA: DEAD/DEAH box helicase, partial [Candidatus Absconditabacterales bacterium]|nr:DEAD/DEAH box helicase [Candidatus Absconditabacterales bacterium]